MLAAVREGVGKPLSLWVGGMFTIGGTWCSTVVTEHCGSLSPFVGGVVGYCQCWWGGGGPLRALVVGCHWCWWWAIIGVDWGWWWVLAASHVTRCCCEQSSSCHCCVFITCPGSMVVVSYRHGGVVVICRRQSSSSIGIMLSPAFVVVALCCCSRHIVSCRHLLVVKLVELGQVCSPMDNGQQTRNLSLSMINICMSVVGEEERTNVGG